MALSLAQIVMTSVVAGMGTVAVASNYVAVQTESICYLPAFGVASAATALVGQSIGARRLDMAKRFAYGNHDLRLHPGIFHGALNVRLRALPHQPPDC